MAEYNVSASTRSEIVSLNSSLSKVHPEMEQRGRHKDGFTDSRPGQQNEKKDNSSEDIGLEADHALQIFNAFLEKDSFEHPEHRHNTLLSTENQVRALTRGDYGYDEDESDKDQTAEKPV